MRALDQLGRLRVALIALLAVCALVVGCTPRPSAPALDDEPIYRNARTGLRFCRPEGWVQWSRGDVPAGALDGERLLVEYRSITAEEPASLEVTVATVAPTTPLIEHVKKATLTGEEWRLAGPAEEFRINDEPAVRLVYARRQDKKRPMREIVAFRRGDRVYFFKGFYDRSDTHSRRELRSALETVVW